MKPTPRTPPKERNASPHCSDTRYCTRGTCIRSAQDHRVVPGSFRGTQPPHPHLHRHPRSRMGRLHRRRIPTPTGMPPRLGKPRRVRRRPPNTLARNLPTMPPKHRTTHRRRTTRPVPPTRHTLKKKPRTPSPWPNRCSGRSTGGAMPKPQSTQTNHTKCKGLSANVRQH